MPKLPIADDKFMYIKYLLANNQQQVGNSKNKGTSQRG